MNEEGLISKIVVCDINQEALEEMRVKKDIEIENNWYKLHDDEELQLVSIVSPSLMRYEMAKQFMLKGKDILIEKPMAMSSKECDELIKISQETGSGIMVGHIFRFHSAANELKRRIEQNEFSEII